MVAHLAIAAVPALGTPNRSLTQDLLVNRYLYFIDAAEDPTAFDPTNDNGSIVKLIGYNGKLFWYDPLDSTTAHDGVSTLVTAGGERYKIEGADFLVRRVLDKDLAEPTGTESIGDAFIVPSAAIGEFATHDDKIGIKTARGFEFLVATAGMIVQVADEDKLYRFNEAGAWILAVDPQPASVLASMLNGDRTHWVIENQTTNTPPTTGKGVAHIVGPAPTDAWVGHSGKIAVRETEGTSDIHTLYTPKEGWTAFDKALNITLIYNDGVWASASGAIIVSKDVKTDGTETVSTGGSGAYSYAPQTPPTTSQDFLQDDATITHTAKVATAKLRFHYKAISRNSSLSQFAIGLFRDSETNAIAHGLVTGISADAFADVDFTALITAGDTNEHTYKMRLIGDVGGGRPSGIELRIFELEEKAT